MVRMEMGVQSKERRVDDKWWWMMMMMMMMVGVPMAWKESRSEERRMAMQAM